MQIKYAFHIGERCQFLAFLKSKKLVSSDTCFSGIYVSFDSAIEIINDRFINFAHNIVKYRIEDLHAGNKNCIQFIDCDPEYDLEKKQSIEKKLLQGKQDFFFKENYYKSSNYCMHLKYTDEANIGLNDGYFVKSQRYCFMPNSDYSLSSMKEAVVRRSDRFLQCLDEHVSSVLLLYMDKLINTANLNERMTEVENKYTLPQQLFFFIPFYTTDNSRVVSFTKKVNNIVFCCVQFQSLEYQKNHNPNDDNCLGNYNASFETMKTFLLQSYEMSNILYLY
jgi:hypothetical protein